MGFGMDNLKVPDPAEDNIEFDVEKPESNMDSSIFVRLSVI